MEKEPNNMNKDNQYFTEKLAEEKKGILDQLKGIAVEDRTRPGRWQATSGENSEDVSMNGDSAESLEVMSERQQLVDSLAQRLAEISRAEERIKEGKGGICAVCGEAIEEERREADPASITCKVHREQEDTVSI